MSAPPVGIIGIGRMGSGMARNTLRAGHPTSVYDVRAEACGDLVERGAVYRSSPREVAEASDLTVLSLLSVDIVAQVLYGEDGICAADLTGKIVVDTSTGVPSESQRFAVAVRELGGSMLDAPVTGGEAGAAGGTLTVMVGGDEEAFQQAADLLAVIGEKVVYVGPSGSGQVAKLANQMMMVSAFCAIAEAFGFMERMGVDAGRCLEAIEHGGARSGLLSGFARQYRQAVEAAGGGEQAVATDLHYAPLFAKDASYVLREGLARQCYLPMTSTAQEILKQVLSLELRGPFPLQILNLWREQYG